MVVLGIDGLNPLSEDEQEIDCLRRNPHDRVSNGMRNLRLSLSQPSELKKH